MSLASPALSTSVTVARPAQCGEGPFWHSPSNSVYWVDIIGQEILQTDFATTQTSVTEYHEMVGAAAPRASGGVVGAVASGFVGLDAAGTVTNQVDCLPEGVRMNDAKPDPNGNFWAGSCAYDFTEGLGGLWRLTAQWEAELVLPNLTQPNGLGWSPDGATFYLVETQARQVLSFPFDPVTSTLRNEPTVLIGPDKFPHFPDGLAVDAQGNLWIAEFGSGHVHEFDSAGSLLRTVTIPTAQPTSCAFVGPDLDRLWVTSAAAGLDLAADPNAGSIFEIRGHGTTGLPVSEFKG